MATIRSGARGLPALGRQCCGVPFGLAPPRPRHQQHHHQQQQQQQLQRRPAARTISSTASLVPPASQSPAADIEIAGMEKTSSLTAPAPDESDIKRWELGRKLSRESDFELPHARYQYHPPAYDRGPLHPVQSPPSSDPTSRNFVPGPFNLPRLRQTYESTIIHDLVTMTYVHKTEGRLQPPIESQFRGWDKASPYNENRSKRGPKGGEHLYPKERAITWQNVPEITEVTLAAHVPAANSNKDYIWTARAAMQAVTGVVPTIFKTKSPVTQWKTKRGRMTGVKATVEGDRAYELLDKCLNLVFPKIKDWPGIKGSTGDGAGNLSFGLTPTHFAYFPEIEVNYDQYPPRLIPGVYFYIKTTAKSDRQARLLLKTMGFPFYGKYRD
jgi:large subunit ribosomal protein L5